MPYVVERRTTTHEWSGRLDNKSRRVLLVLLTDAEGLTTQRISAAAGLRRSTTGIIHHLVSLGWVRTNWSLREPSQGIYRLTGDGRSRALALVGLEEGEDRLDRATGEGRR